MKIKNVILHRLLQPFLWPMQILALLQSIDRKLGAIEAQSKKLGDCITDENHRERKCVRTGHWNDR